MRRTCALFLLATSWALPVHAQPQPAPQLLRAVRTLYSTSQLGGLVKAWCDARAPETRAETAAALAEWRRTHGLDDIEARAERLPETERATVEASVAARRERVFRSLDKESRSPATDCRRMLAYLNASANPQRLHPMDVRLLAAERAREQASRGGAAQVEAGTAVRAPSGAAVATARGGVLYTVAQLSALVAQDRRTADTRLRRLGSITVRGTLERYDPSRPDDPVWLNTREEGWRSTTSVRCYDHSFGRHLDRGQRELAVRGTVRSVDSWIVLDDCQVVSDLAGLESSPISDSTGRRRVSVNADDVRTAPNAGVRLADIVGVYQPSDLRFNPMSLLYEPDETTYLVLNDGWLHDNLMASPHDLNVERSRRLEPQRWHRWRRRGSAFEVQRFDEYGRPSDRWEVKRLTRRAPVGARRLAGTFSTTASATAGLMGGGGAVSVGTTSWTFRANGTFSWTNFTRIYASNTTGTGDGGATIAAGGAMIGPGGASASSVGGGEDGGTYTTDGYTLELRTRNGTVFRFPIFSWDTAKYRDYLVINGTTYAPPK